MYTRSRAHRHTHTRVCMHARTNTHTRIHIRYTHVVGDFEFGISEEELHRALEEIKLITIVLTMSQVLPDQQLEQLLAAECREGRPIAC